MNKHMHVKGQQSTAASVQPRGSPPWLSAVSSKGNAHLLDGCLVREFYLFETILYGIGGIAHIL